ncbi:MAG: transglutaminase-like domain-containing protein [Candidatus Bipolaricaulis sp.]|nr:transglutaminase-like domain-containing protein [Candidatus Bipolaricaulis sp.]
MHCAMTTTDDLLAYYRRHSTNSNPGTLASLYNAVPDDLPQLCRMVQNTVIHLFWIRGATYGSTLGELKAARRRLCTEFGSSTAEERLRNIVQLQDAPLTEPRTPARRTVGGCRDFALMLVSILRHRGIPARVRTGVALYLDPSRPEDHDVAELWNAVEGRWQMADAQIDDVQRKAMRISLDTTDLDPGLFLTGWRLLDALRSGRIANPERVGFPPANAGLTYGRNKLFADFVSVTGTELPVRAWWGIRTPDRVKAGDGALLDRMIALVRGIDQNDPASLSEALSLAESHPRLRMPTGYAVPPWAPASAWGLPV